MVDRPRRVAQVGRFGEQVWEVQMIADTGATAPICRSMAMLVTSSRLPSVAMALRWNVAPRMSTQSSSPACWCHWGPSLVSAAVVDHSATSHAHASRSTRVSPKSLTCWKAIMSPPIGHHPPGWIMFGRPGREVGLQGGR